MNHPSLSHLEFSPEQRANVNVPLLRKAVEWAEAEAARPVDECRWDQTTWVSHTECGTSYCIAGYVAQLVDPRFTYHDNVIEDGEDETSASVAEKALGLSGSMVVLFRGSNSIADVRAIAEAIAGEPL